MTGLDIANASLLDEGTAAAEAMALTWRHNTKRRTLYLSDAIHPQTLAVVQTRAADLDLKVIVGPISEANLAGREIAGILLQYPDTFGDVVDFSSVAKTAKMNGVSLFIVGGSFSYLINTFV